MTDLPGRQTWTDGDSALLADWADKKMPAMGRFLVGDDDAFDEVVKDALELARAAMVRDVDDPLEPEPEDDEETITYPEVWDRMGDHIVIWSCIAALAVFWGAPIALALWAVTR